MIGRAKRPAERDARAPHANAIWLAESATRPQPIKADQSRRLASCCGRERPPSPLCVAYLEAGPSVALLGVGVCKLAALTLRASPICPVRLFSDVAGVAEVAGRRESESGRGRESERGKSGSIGQQHTGARREDAQTESARNERRATQAGREARRAKRKGVGERCTKAGSGRKLGLAGRLLAERAAPVCAPSPSSCSFMGIPVIQSETNTRSDFSSSPVSSSLAGPSGGSRFANRTFARPTNVVVGLCVARCRCGCSCNRRPATMPATKRAGREFHLRACISFCQSDYYYHLGPLARWERRRPICTGERRPRAGQPAGRPAKRAASGLHIWPAHLFARPPSGADEPAACLPFAVCRLPLAVSSFPAGAALQAKVETPFGRLAGGRRNLLLNERKGCVARKRA